MRMKKLFMMVMPYLHKRRFILLLAALPLIFCVSIPLVLFSGDMHQMGKCLFCRIMAIITKDGGNRLC